MFISVCPLPSIGSHVEWVNETVITSPLPYNTVLEYKCETGYGFVSNASNNTTYTVKCEDSATFGNVKQCKIKGMEFN